MAAWFYFKISGRKGTGNTERRKADSEKYCDYQEL